VRIYLHHAKQVEFCAKGMRYFAKKHHLNIAEFISNGIDEEILLATGDETAKKIVEVARNG
jgi:hypothetical protein